jgi:hypothetical protein
MTLKKIILCLSLSLFVLSVVGQTIDTTFSYGELRNKRIIKLKHETKWKKKRIKERTFVGIKTKDYDFVIFGRLDLILENKILLTTLKTNRDTVIIEHSDPTISEPDTIILQSADYDTSYFISFNEIQSIYRSTNHQMIKTEVASLLLVTGIELILVPPLVGALMTGQLFAFGGIVYMMATGGILTTWGILELRNIRRFKEYDLTKNWRIEFKKKGF